VHRTWRTPDGIITSIWLIEFATSDDARSYVLSTELGDGSDPVNKVQFAVPRVSDGIGIARPTLDNAGFT
jgi:hypothetical protein